MEISVSELLEGQATLIKNKQYLATKEYVQPFLDKMSAFTNDFRVLVKLPDQITTKDSTQNITYNRVLIEAVLPKEYSVDGHDEVIGFLYGLDVRKPISKVYRGYLNAARGLTVFDPKWLVVNEIKPDESITFDIDKLMSLPTKFEATVKQMKSEFIGKGEITNHLGRWVDTTLRNNYYNGIQNVKISPNVPVEAYKSLFTDEGSGNFVHPNKEASIYDAHNAFTTIISNDDKDIMNRFEKTMMVNTLLSVK